MVAARSSLGYEKPLLIRPICALGFQGLTARAAEGTKTNRFWYTFGGMNKRAAIYARVSTGEQTAQNSGVSVASQ
jgi:hypothetical protein